jgi:hypothetical protein
MQTWTSPEIRAGSMWIFGKDIEEFLSLEKKEVNTSQNWTRVSLDSN